MKPDAKLLECLTCAERWSLQDVEAGAYRAESLTCSRCLARMQAEPHGRSCFGKATWAVNGKRLLGYDADAAECAGPCPDREACRSIVDAPSGKRRVRKVDDAWEYVEE